MASFQSMAGEIIVGTSAPVESSIATESGRNASHQREAAKAYIKGQASAVVSVPPVISDESDEDGVMSPRRAPSGAGGNDAAENAARARAYQPGRGDAQKTAPAIFLESPTVTAQPQTPAARQAQNQRARAIEYRTGASGVSGSSAAVSADGLPVVDCAAVGNSAGRIGEAQPGSVVILIQGQNQVKARCR